MLHPKMQLNRRARERWLWTKSRLPSYGSLQPARVDILASMLASNPNEDHVIPGVCPIPRVDPIADERVPDRLPRGQH